MFEESLASSDTVSSFIKHQDHPSCLWYTLHTFSHMALESSRARYQVPLFYNTETQWLNSSAIIKKGLWAFNSDGEQTIKQIHQELQHQCWVGGADSIDDWLTECWDDTVTAILVAEGNWHHQWRAQDYCWIQGQCAERCQHSHLVGISHVCPTHTLDGVGCAVFYNTDSHNIKM